MLRRMIVFNTFLTVLILGLLFISLKTGYINNMVFAGKILFMDENKSLDITQVIKKRASTLWFRNELLDKLNKDITFNALYTLEVSQTSWNYLPLTNSLSLTDAYINYSKDSAIKKINEGSYDSTIRHELIHYFLQNDKNLKNRIFKLQQKIVKKDYKYLSTMISIENKPFTPFDKELFHPINSLSNLTKGTYNPKGIESLLILEQMKDSYTEIKNTKKIREEVVTNAFESGLATFAGKLKDRQLNYYKNNDLYKKYYLTLFKESTLY